MNARAAGMQLTAQRCSLRLPRCRRAAAALLPLLPLPQLSGSSLSFEGALAAAASAQLQLLLLLGLSGHQGAMQLELLWVVPAAVAATFDTLADVISDEVVAGEDDSSEEEDEEQAKKLLGGAEPPQRPCCCPHLETKQKLTGEQDFMVSMMPMVCASVAIAATRPPDSVLHTPLMLAETDLGHVAFLAGLAYAIGYLALLKAWELVPSTVIVPCLQLSSPMVEIIEALLAPHHATHPVLAPLRGASLSVRSVSAFVIVFIGGMMASVGDDGSLAELCSPELWRERSMLWMMGGNLAFSVYCACDSVLASVIGP